MTKEDAVVTGSASGASDPRTNWTIMVYLAGDNNVADECVYTLTEMKAADTGRRIKVLAQFDAAGRRVATRRFLINQELHNDAPADASTDAAAKTELDAEAAARQKANGGLATVTVTRADQYSRGPRRRGSILEDKLEEGLPGGKVSYDENGHGTLARPPRDDNAGADHSHDEGETSTGDPRTLFDFISWSVENHPADHYMVVLRGHGSGFASELLRDENPKGTLEISELGKVFGRVRSGLKTEDGKPLVIDVLGMDSCLMSMAEVCYELHGNVKYMVSTESYGPLSGWPYRNILERLDAAIAESGSGDVTPAQLGSMIVEEHAGFYFEYSLSNGLSVDISMIDVEQAGRLREEIDRLASALEYELKRGATLPTDKGRSDFLDQIVLAHWEAQSYNGEKFVDLYDFCDCLMKRYDPKFISAPPPDDKEAALSHEEEVTARRQIQERCAAMKGLIDGTVVIRSCYTGIAYQYSYGVSVYFPWAEVSREYDAGKLKFVADSGWPKFLDTYVKVTRRKPRGYEFAPRTYFKYKAGNVLKTPLDGMGPDDLIVESMRNPPIRVVEGGLSNCIREQPEKVEIIERLLAREEQHGGHDVTDEV